MKKILILAYDFPPYNSIGGKRPYSWYKYMAESGFYPVVITRHWDKDLQNEIDFLKPSKNRKTEIEENENGTIIRVPYTPNIRDRFTFKFGLNRLVIVRKILSFLLGWIRFYSKYWDHTFNIYLEAEKYLHANPCSVILATGEPFILFKYASQLASKFDTPWIADYRDGWTTDTLYNRYEKRLLKSIYLRLEKRYLKSCSLITTVAPSCKKDLETLNTNKSIEVVYNGYDFNHLSDLDAIQQSKDVFEIAYAGTIYDLQPVEVFLEGYRNFIRETKCSNTRAIFYGANLFSDHKKRVLSFDKGLNKYLVTTDRIPYEEAMRSLKRANILLLLANETYQSIHVKTFEYLALNRRILLVKDDKGEMGRLIDESRGGIKCSSVEDVKSALMEAYAEYSTQGFVNNESYNFNAYSRQNQCKVLANIINDIS